MTELEYKKHSKELIEECYYDAIFALRNGMMEVEDAYEALEYFEEREEYLNCAGIKKALDEWELELLSDLFTTAGEEEGSDNTVL